MQIVLLFCYHNINVELQTFRMYRLCCPWKLITIWTNGRPYSTRTRTCTRDLTASIPTCIVAYVFVGLLVLGLETSLPN